jgi:hypothetical protein
MSQPKPALWRRVLVWIVTKVLPKDIDRKLGGG